MNMDCDFCNIKRVKIFAKVGEAIKSRLQRLDENIFDVSYVDDVSNALDHCSALQYGILVVNENDYNEIEDRSSGAALVVSDRLNLRDRVTSYVPEDFILGDSLEEFIYAAIEKYCIYKELGRKSQKKKEIERIITDIQKVCRG